MKRTLWSWLGCCLLVSALRIVPPPENVRMNSVNFKNILQWESPAFSEGNLTYTAQFQSYNSFQDKCKNTALMECDFSSISKYGDHILRVRTEFEDKHSDWVNITFCPVDDTVIGPPELQIEVLADSIHIRFLAPRVVSEIEIWTMKNIYSSMVYNVQYWKNGTDKKFQMIAPYDFEVLRNLEPWTTYCIQAQGFLHDQNKSGEWSQPVCEQTTKDETVSSWIIAISLIGSVFLAFLMLLSCFALMWYIYKKIKYIFVPGNSLPQHLKEFLSYPHHGPLQFFSIPPSNEDEVFDKLSVITEDLQSNKQSSGSSCKLRTLAKQVSFEPVSEEETAHQTQSPPALTFASERDQCAKPRSRSPEQTPTLELSGIGPL